MNEKKQTKKLAAVTGASSGIGWATAIELAKRGYDLIVIARRQSRLEELKRQIEAGGQSKVHVLVADLSKGEDFQRLASDLSGHHVDLLINNAGVGYYGSVLQQDPARLASELQVLVVSLTFLTSAVGAQMAQRGGGTVVNVSSGIAYASVSPGNAVYAAAKRYVWDFTRAVNYENEMLKNNVRAVSVQPGLIVSDLSKVSQPDPNQPAPATGLKRTSAEEFAKAMVDGIEAGKTDFDYGELIAELKAIGETQKPEIYIKQVMALLGRKEQLK